MSFFFLGTGNLEGLLRGATGSVGASSTVVDSRQGGSISEGTTVALEDLTGCSC